MSLLKILYLDLQVLLMLFPVALIRFQVLTHIYSLYALKRHCRGVYHFNSITPKSYGTSFLIIYIYILILCINIDKFTVFSNFADHDSAVFPTSYIFILFIVFIIHIVKKSLTSHDPPQNVYLQSTMNQLLLTMYMRCDNGSRSDWLYDAKTHIMPCPILLFNNHYYCYLFNYVIILLYNIFPGCMNNYINVRKKLFLLSKSIKYVHFIAFYDRKNYKTKKQPHNLQTITHGNSRAEHAGTHKIGLYLKRNWKKCILLHILTVFISSLYSDSLFRERTYGYLTKIGFHRLTDNDNVGSVRSLVKKLLLVVQLEKKIDRKIKKIIFVIITIMVVANLFKLAQFYLFLSTNDIEMNNTKMSIISSML
ncbi:hypothetical protein AGLY_005564 [Aphis glycines]|uniref:Uncharacterized protein n=1 Tax=Aphis glycines TaxID=307491 RepID=A0A6G0TTA4_APHGL|nr:hypothetical protein AGLY_005564 [Aphis glycines]